MRFSEKEHTLIAREGNETVEIIAWGSNGLRVRATKNPCFSQNDKALEYVAPTHVSIRIKDTYAEINNGKLSCRFDKTGFITFFKNNKQILKEYARSFNKANDHSSCLAFDSRILKPIFGDRYALTLRFEGNPEEKIFGMGQYQQSNLDLKSCILELAQRNSQITIPFYLSNLGYGFLWNHPGIGEVMFGSNYTQWTAECAQEMDYWITAGDTPKEILMHYTEVTGRAPEFPENALGLWQSKLRYRTQEEVLSVAREYKRRGIPLDVIVIDFFHWIYQGDWAFDPKYWPNPAAMIRELKEMGIRCMVSVWPSVDRKSVHYAEMRELGYLVRTERGTDENKNFCGSTVYFDPTNPDARQYVWKIIRENYFNLGIDLFWLDVAEPEFSHYDFDNFRYYTGSALEVTNAFPLMYAKTFYDGQKQAHCHSIISLVRSAWVGSQKYGTLVWSGDVNSTFTCLRDQVAAGLNIGIAGIPWWSSDTGGFFGNIHDPHFNELLIRWFQFSTFCPALRLHGDRKPRLPLFEPNATCGGGFVGSGQPNELWSYGEEVYEILKKYLNIRLEMKSYIKSLMDEASENGSPVIRPMFYEFPDDKTCWEWNEQYMFGSKYLVAPILYQGMTERTVYLPYGQWKNIHTNEIHAGMQKITVQAPLEIIPVFQRIS